MRYHIITVLLLAAVICLSAAGVFADDPVLPFAIGADSTGREEVFHEPPEVTSDDQENFDPQIGDFPAEENDDVPSYAIFGGDDRDKYYYGTRTYPYTAVVYVTTNQGVCSGFMIGPHYAVTAAHCLWDENKGWAKTVTVCPGSAGSDKPYGCTTANYQWMMGGYNHGANRDYDVGLLRLDKAIGNSSGWLGSYTIKDSECYGYVMVMGNHGSYWYRSTGYLDGTTYNGKRLKYKLDTLPGSSGGPVVMYHDGDWAHIVGINVSHDSSYNYAVRFDMEVYNFLHPYWGK